MLRGLEKRHKATGNVPAIIHSSGNGILSDDAKGAYPTDTVYPRGTIYGIVSNKFVDLGLENSRSAQARARGEDGAVGGGKNLSVEDSTP
ncbi:hypothetical protein C0991_008931 [Blastosporella zonata]|nr:hypothetical protein C0991_008931 [Blastosporella zonata]